MLVSRCAKSHIQKHVKTTVKANFKRRLRTDFKSTFTGQKLFKCQNHKSNSWNKLHDMIVGDHKEGKVLYNI